MAADWSVVASAIQQNSPGRVCRCLAWVEATLGSKSVCDKPAQRASLPPSLLAELTFIEFEAQKLFSQPVGRNDDSHLNIGATDPLDPIAPPQIAETDQRKNGKKRRKSARVPILNRGGGR